MTCLAAYLSDIPEKIGMNSGNFVDAKSLYTLLENSHQQNGCTTELMLPCPYISRQGIFLERSHARFVWH